MPIEPPLVLGSASPRRKDLLQNVGCQCDVAIADIDESLVDGEAPTDYVLRVAAAKAAHLSESLAESVILTADTTVAVNNRIFGKPLHQDHAYEMWSEMSGTWHQVITGVCLRLGEEIEQVAVATDVRFAQLDKQQMTLYWQSGEPQDKAGGYAIQGLASAWVQEVRGSYSNVVGLPLFETNQLLRRVGHNWL